MSVQYTKEFKMLDNNENRRKKKCIISSSIKPLPELKGKGYAVNCFKQCTRVTSTSQKRGARAKRK